MFENYRFIREIKNYKLSSILEISSSLSMKLWMNDEPVVRFHLFEKTSSESNILIKKGSSFLTPWNLADISYYAIKYTNELSTRKITEHEFMNLYGLFLGFDDEISKKDRESKQFDDESMFFYILFGLMQKTFWYQEGYRMINKFVRFNLLLTDNYNDNVNLQSIIEDEFKVEFSNVVLASFVLMIMAQRGTIIKFPIALDKQFLLYGKNSSLLHDIIRKFATDYSCFRKSTLNQKQMFVTPIIEIGKDEYKILNSFIYANKCLGFIYWYTREKYKKSYGKEINQHLGMRFEKYVDKILKKFNIKFERLKEDKKQKRADLIVNSQKYILLIEQKFKMFNISEKDIIFDLEKIDYVFKEYIKAVKQLSRTEQTLDKEIEIIKLVLYFDDIFLADGVIKERLEKISNDDDCNFHNAFMINIEEFEILIQILNNDQELFEKIIIEKIERQYSEGHVKGIEFMQIMQEFECFENRFIEDELDKTVILKKSI